MKINWKRENTPEELHAMLTELGEYYDICESGNHGLIASFAKIEGKHKNQLIKNGNNIEIQYSSLVSAGRAISTVLSDLIDEEKSTESSFQTSGIMLDCSRNAVMKVGKFKEWLRQLCLMGHNMAMLYTEDTFELPDEPYFGYLRGAYTADELKEIDAYADTLGIEMIPCFQTVGHLAQVLKWPAYKEISDDGYCVMVDEPDTYVLIEKMIKFWSEVFTSHRIHIGMDECWSLGLGARIKKYGYERDFDLFNRHLRKIIDICKKYNKKPMIWSDMYFRMGASTNDGEYDPNFVIPEEVVKTIPEDCDFVYWEYEKRKPEVYETWIEQHKKLGHTPMLAGASWALDLFYNKSITEPCVSAGIEGSINSGVEELLYCVWGDDGAMCNVDSVVAGFAYAAEKTYTGNVDVDKIAKRFKVITGMNYKAIRKAAELANPTDVVDKYIKSTPAALDDPIHSIYLNNLRSVNHNILPVLSQKYANIAKSLEEAIDKDNPYDCINFAVVLTTFLSKKLKLVEDVSIAYFAKDKVKLAELKNDINEVSKSLKVLADTYRTLWMKNNKSFGFETLQIRFAGQIERYNELDRVLTDYIEKDATIEALDANMPYAPAGDLGSFFYSFLGSATNIR